MLGAATCAEGSRAFLAIPVQADDERLRAEGVRHFFEPEHLVVAGEGAEGWAHRVDATGAAVAPASDAVVGGVFREWFPARGGYGYLEATFGADGARFALLPQAHVETGEGDARVRAASVRRAHIL